MKILHVVVFLLAAEVCAAGNWTLTLDPMSRGDVSVPASVPSLMRGETETNRIDLLVVYDAAARRWLNERGLAPEGHARSCIDDLNRSLAYTGIDDYFRFRLAAAIDLSPLDFSDYELGDIVSSFTQSLSARHLDERVVEQIKKSRDESRADIVVFLAKGKKPNIYGYSDGLEERDLTSERLNGNAEKAYCACKIETLDARHTLLHEIGHLFGAGHSTMQNRSPGPLLFPFSAAYRFGVGETLLTTVVGYPEVKDGLILPFFSSPRYRLTYSEKAGVVARDVPVGTPTNDNTRTVIATYRIIAQYRAAKPTEAGARFERGLAFSLEEKGRGIATSGGEVVLRCGVKRTFALKFTGGDAHVRVRISKLPAGFSYDEQEKTVFGKAVRTGVHTVTFGFEHPNDGLRVNKRVAFRIEPLPPWAVGRFVSDDGKSYIDVSGSGAIRFSVRKGYRVRKVNLEGFTDEEIDANGKPIFVFENADTQYRLSFGGDEQGGVICSADGSVFRAGTKNDIRRNSLRRRGKSNLKTTKTPKEEQS